MDQDELIKIQQAFQEENSKRIVMDDTFFSEYSNAIQVGFSRFDVSMTFLKNSSSQGQKYLGEIILSPEHAKVLAIILSNNIQGFEEQFGEIDVTDLFTEMGK